MTDTATKAASEPTVAVHDTIRAEMARRRISQQQLAAGLGLHQQGVSMRLAGRVPFTVDQLVAAAKVLGVPAADLLP